MAEPRFYADASALIGLGRIGHLDLLTLLSAPVYVTALVWEEVAGDATRPEVASLERGRTDGVLAAVEEGDPEAYPQLDPGESTVLTAAAAAEAAVLVDERRARALLRTDPVLRQRIAGSTGLLGLILVAKRRGRIPAARPLLDELLRQNFRMSPNLY